MLTGVMPFLMKDVNISVATLRLKIGRTKLEFSSFAPETREFIQSMLATRSEMRATASDLLASKYLSRNNCETVSA